MLIGGRYAVAPELILHAGWSRDSEAEKYRVVVALSTGTILSWCEEKKDAVDKALADCEKALREGEEVRANMLAMMPVQGEDGDSDD